MSLSQIYLKALAYLAADGRRVALICTANVVLAMVMIAEPILFGRIIDAVSGEGDIYSTMIMWAGLGVFNIVAFVLVAREADRLAHRRRAALTCDAYEKIIAMPLSWHRERGTSNALHTLLRAMETLFNIWLEFMRQHLSTAVALILLVPTALALDMRMAGVLLCLGASYVAINRFVMRRTKNGQAHVERHYHRVFAHVNDTIANVSVLQSYGRMGREAEALRSLSADLLSAQYPVLSWWALANALQRLAATISMMIVLAIGAFLVQRGELRIGDVVAFTGFATLLIGRLDQVAAFVNQVFEARAKLEPFYEMERAAEMTREPADLPAMPRARGHVVFDEVNFEFEGTGAGLRDISFEVQAGQTVAIVGPTGAGKTTLIDLLQRVHDPRSGAIRIDGIDVRSVTRASLREQIATVFQDAGLLDRSIEANIRLGRQDASNDEVHSAAAIAAAEDFILAKSRGYDTIAGERGGQLSGGERQRLAIARAVLKDAPILVLDEATSALDTETEHHVKRAIDTIRRNRTTFVIAHRLSTVSDADLVLFMDKGRIVEAGRFQELAQLTDGRFASLLRSGGLLEERRAEAA